MDAEELLTTRRSIRKYKKKEIPQQELIKIAEIARLAPSARNIQPWKLVVIKNKETLKKLAKITSPNGDFLKQATAAVVVLCEDTKYYLEDGSAVTTYLLLAAWSRGIGSCWIAGDKKPYAEEVKKMLGAPQNYKLVSIVALGYPDEKPVKQKKSLDEVLVWESFT